MKQKYLSRAPAVNSTAATVPAVQNANHSNHRENSTATRPFQSRFLGAGKAKQFNLPRQ